MQYIPTNSSWGHLLSLRPKKKTLFFKNLQELTNEELKNSSKKIQNTTVLF